MGVVIHSGSKQAGGGGVVRVIPCGLSPHIAGASHQTGQTRRGVISSSAPLGKKQAGGGRSCGICGVAPVLVRLANISSIYGYRWVLIVPRVHHCLALVNQHARAGSSRLVVRLVPSVSSGVPFSSRAPSLGSLRAVSHRARVSRLTCLVRLVFPRRSRHHVIPGVYQMKPQGADVV